MTNLKKSKDHDSQSKQSKDNPRCFIAMPITTTDEHAEKYNDSNHWNHLLRSLIVPAVRKAGFEPIEPSAQGSDLIHQNIVQNINDSELVLVDLSTHNPNVFFELGMRIALNKPIVIIVDDLHKVPVDLSIINYHTYASKLNYFDIDSQIEKLFQHINKSWERNSSNNSLWDILSINFDLEEGSQESDPSKAAFLMIIEKINQLSEDISRNQRIANNSNDYPLYSPKRLQSGAESKIRISKVRKILESLNLGDPYRFNFSYSLDGLLKIEIRYSPYITPEKDKIIDALSDYMDYIFISFVKDESLLPF